MLEKKQIVFSPFWLHGKTSHYLRSSSENRSGNFLPNKNTTPAAIPADGLPLLFQSSPLQAFIPVQYSIIPNDLILRSSASSDLRINRFSWTVNTGSCLGSESITRREKEKDNKKDILTLRSSPIVRISLFFSWWSWSGSNRLPLHCQCSALPGELQPHCL